jgi:hexosaminidase
LNILKVKPDTIVEVWKGGYPAELGTVTSLGYKTLLSSCWYLSDITYGTDWPKYYNCDPYNFSGISQFAWICLIRHVE